MLVKFKCIQSRLWHCWSNIFASIRELIQLAQDLQSEFDAYGGDRGVERHVQDVWHLWGVVFDFKSWLDPTPAHKAEMDAAFAGLWSKLWPDLHMTFWPPVETHPDVPHY